MVQEKPCDESRAANMAPVANIGLDLMAYLLRARRCRALAARTATAQATVRQNMQPTICSVRRSSKACARRMSASCLAQRLARGAYLATSLKALEKNRTNNHA